MEFVEGWIISQILGEGTYGEVKLLTNRTSGEEVAMKVIDLAKNPGAQKCVRREICIQRMLRDPHIVQFYGERREGDKHYLFLEYISGGELFDRIEPDVGMARWEAQKFFGQLMAGVEYLHCHGVVHRDLKPENLLLDINDNLKIADFGFASIFRYRGEERLLEKLCGSYPYMAPEVLTGSYHGEPVDLWSCGIILVSLLTGALPWDKPTQEHQEYITWRDNNVMRQHLWGKIDPLAQTLVQRILDPDPSTRSRMKEIMAHPWCKKEFPRLGSPNRDINPPQNKRICPETELSSTSPPIVTNDSSDDSMTRPCRSQPEPRLQQPTVPVSSVAAAMQRENPPFSFSQPVYLDDMLLNSQLNTTQTSTQNTYLKLVRRMTRFFVQTNYEETVEKVCKLLNSLSFSWKFAAKVLTITTTDRRNMKLIFKTTLLNMDGKTLLDFRLSKGCGLEFKRNFIHIKQNLEDIVLKEPVMWPITITTNNIL